MMNTVITMNTMNIDGGILKLMQALDSLFPIGAFTLSNGMETYTQKEIVTDGASLSAFLDAYLYTLPYNDGGFAAKAALGEDHRMLDKLCAASKSPYELRNGSSKLCTRFIKAEQALGNYSGLKKYAEDISAGVCGGYHCIAVGIFMRDIGIDMNEGLGMYFYSLLSSLVNHAVKLVPLRQLDGQKSLSESMEKIPCAVQKAIASEIYDLGISGGGFDLRSMQHEKLYSRIYIS
ncbi:MAG: hypothetical protein K6C13_05600 [Oscillospiraceae bacterium]|nr:hypothetical protein [Oscillospiraceae bacterium]